MHATPCKDARIFRSHALMTEINWADSQFPSCLTALPLWTWMAFVRLLGDHSRQVLLQGKAPGCGGAPAPLGRPRTRGPALPHCQPVAAVVYQKAAQAAGIQCFVEELHGKEIRNSLVNNSSFPVDVRLQRRMPRHVLRISLKETVHSRCTP